MLTLTSFAGVESEETEKMENPIKMMMNGRCSGKEEKNIIFQLLSLIRLQQIIRSFSLFNMTSFTSISLRRCFKRKMKDWVWSGISLLVKMELHKIFRYCSKNDSLQIVKIHSFNCRKRFKFQFHEIVPIEWEKATIYNENCDLMRCNRVFSFLLLTVACESICKITFKIPSHLVVHKSLKCKFFHSN